jgi:hypothetical protein
MVRVKSVAEQEMNARGEGRSRIGRSLLAAAAGIAAALGVGAVALTRPFARAPWE